MDAVISAVLHHPFPHTELDLTVQALWECSRLKAGEYPIPLIRKDNFKTVFAS